MVFISHLSYLYGQLIKIIVLFNDTIGRSYMYGQLVKIIVLFKNTIGQSYFLWATY